MDFYKPYYKRLDEITKLAQDGSKIVVVTKYPPLQKEINTRANNEDLGHIWERIANKNIELIAKCSFQGGNIYRPKVDDLQWDHIIQRLIKEKAEVIEL